MTVSRRDWWIGVVMLTAAVIFHAALPRYEWHHTGSVLWMRVDRWTGHAESVRMDVGSSHP